MIFWVFFLSIVIVIIGRYNIVNKHRIMPTKIAYPYVCLFIIGITIFRYDVGIDWSHYYSYIYPELNLSVVENFELIPRQIYIIADFFKSPLLVFILHQGVALILFFICFSKYSVSRYESYIVFLCVFYLEFLSYIRQWLAIAILFYGFRYVKEKQIIKYIICASIAFFCHRSSIIAAICIYCIYNYVSIKLCIVCCLIALLFGKELINILAGTNLPYIKYFRNIDLFDVSGRYSKIFYVLLWCGCFFLLKHSDFYQKKILSIVLFGITLPFIFGGHLGSRIGSYFYFYYVLLIPEAITHLRNKRCSNVIMFFFYLYFLLLLFVNSNSGTSAYIPYQFYPLTPN